MSASRFTLLAYSLGSIGLCAAAEITVPPGSDAAIQDAIANAEDGDFVRLVAGTYFIDNPIAVGTAGIEVRGAGAGLTTIRPLNASEAVFFIQASNVAITSLDIEGSVEGTDDKAAFGVLFDDGVQGCNISRVRIARTQASAILGPAVSDCYISDNTIIDAGDDGMRLRGSRLTISGNTISNIFDEAIDIGDGDDVHVQGNSLSGGRIGLTIYGGSRTSVVDNSIVNQALGGMHLACFDDCFAARNIIRETGGTYAYKFEGPFVVLGNLADKSSGIVVEYSTGAVYVGNEIRDGNFGFRIDSSNGIRLHDNQWCGASDDALIGEDSDLTGIERPQCKDTDLELEPGMPASDVSSVTDYRESGSPEIRVDDQSQSGAFLNSLVDQFAWHNPGVLSLSLGEDGHLVSDIETGLHLTLKAYPKRAVGSVRAPYLRYFNLATDVLPLWYLKSEGRKVAIVSWHRRGGNVIVRHLGDGGTISLSDRLGLALDWIPQRLRQTRFAGRVTGREGEWLLAIIVVLSVSLLVLWGARLRKHSR